MQKLMILLALVAVFMPFGVKAGTEDLQVIENNCYLADGAMISQDWRNCQESIVGTVSNLDLVKSEKNLINSVTNQEATVLGPLQEVDSLAKQIEEMGKIIQLLQSIVARYTN